MTDFHFKKMETKAVIFHFLENSFFMSISSFQTWKDGATQSRENLSDASLNVKLSNKTTYATALNNAFLNRYNWPFINSNPLKL